MRKVVSPGGATRAAATFEVGDKVVLSPTTVMTISAIGRRDELAGSDQIALSPPTAASDAVGYVLRTVGEDKDSQFVDGKATTRPPLRHVSTARELEMFIAVLRETLQDARVTKPPARLLEEVAAAGNDLVKLARLYPYLRDVDPAEADAKRALATFFVHEIAVVKGLELRDAQALFDRF